MRLKMQMLVAGLVTLTIPVVGWHSIRQLDDSLEDARRREQELRVNNIVASLATNKSLEAEFDRRVTEPRAGDLFASPARFPLFIDGYEDDWHGLVAPKFDLDLEHEDENTSPATVSVRTTVRDQQLYVFVSVKDDSVVFHKPPRVISDYAEGESPDPYDRLANGDALEMVLHTPSGDAVHGLFRAVAPGPLVARIASNTERRRLGTTYGAWRGHWIATSDGLQLEMSMPVPPDGSTFAIAYVDVDYRGDSRTRWSGSMSPARMAELHRSKVVGDQDPRVLSSSISAIKSLESWVTPTTRARLFDAEGRLLADVNSLYEDDESQVAFDPANSSLWDALVYRIVSAMLRDRNGEFSDSPLYERIKRFHLPKETLADDGVLQGTRRYLTDESDLVLGSLAKIQTTEADAYLLFESNDSRANAYAGSRLAQLLSLLTLVSLVVGGSLLLFATVLSFRIRRLSKRASAAVSKDGRVKAFAASDASDEIGELSRTLGSLLGRTKHYTHYLEALSSRLSHELRTPLSVVKTSIENIDVDKLDDETQSLLQRAGGGADQLGHIIRALVESTRLEQTVQQAQKVAIPLDAFLEGAKERYQQVYPEITFDTEHVGGHEVFASPELLQQALDKLVDNAVSFTTDKRVSLEISSDSGSANERIAISVTNAGSIADDIDPAHVFDPMFSSRAGEDGNLHLGLGLYIVRMVAEAHDGEAKFQAHDGLVSVTMDLPISPHSG